jgi:hypothetical protein
MRSARGCRLKYSPDPLKILLTGRGTSGSWKIRGEQLGHAMGATVVPDAPQHVIDAHDLVIVVKRARQELIARLSRKPVVWDVVDAWPQPEGNSWDRAESLAWLESQMAVLKPIAVVAATDKMAADCRGQVLSLRHHARPGLRANPVRTQVSTVGYEGSARHLGRWKEFFDEECARRGWRFVVNPPELADLDIVIAARETTGYPAKWWKSGVKLANAQGSGTPCIANREAGCVEIATGAQRWADTDGEFRACFDEMESYHLRVALSRQMLGATISLEATAERYRKWLGQLSF